LLEFTKRDSLYIWSMIKQELIHFLSNPELYSTSYSFRQISHLLQITQTASDDKQGSLSERYDSVVKAIRSLFKLDLGNPVQTVETRILPFELDLKTSYFESAQEEIVFRALYLEVQLILQVLTHSLEQVDHDDEKVYLDRELETLLNERLICNENYNPDLQEWLETLDFILCANYLSSKNSLLDWISVAEKKVVQYSIFRQQAYKSFNLNEEWLISQFIKESEAKDRFVSNWFKVLELEGVSEHCKAILFDGLFMQACSAFEISFIAIHHGDIKKERLRLQQQFIKQVEKKIGDSSRSPTKNRQFVVEFKSFIQNWLSIFAHINTTFSISLAQHTFNYLDAIWEASARNAPKIDVEEYEDRFFTLQEVADKLEVSTRSVRTYISKNELKKSKKGNRYGVYNSDLENFIQNQK